MECSLCGDECECESCVMGVFSTPITHDSIVVRK